MKTYRKRIADELLLGKLESSGAVLIEGLKWCGKTTTALQHSGSVLHLDDPSRKSRYLEMADLDPTQLLRGDTPRLIDEWQLAPKLWDAIRFEVDWRGEVGQFILTGSSVPADTSDITHSGTGRFAWLTMRTMSLFESGDSTGEVRLSELFDAPSRISGHSDISLNRLCFLCCRGGWPQALDLRQEAALGLAYEYCEGVIRFDINRVDGVDRTADKVRDFMKAYARNQGSQTSNESLARDFSAYGDPAIYGKTVASYISALKKIFVIEELGAWNPNLRSKTAIRTSPTRFFADPSIAVASLGLGPGDLLNDLHTLGFIFETLCIRDLRVFAAYLNGDVYHYRDKAGQECDAVVHLRNGKYGLIEIKLGGDRLIEEGVASLKRLESNLDTSKMNKPSFSMVLTGIGDYAYRRGDGIYIVPIGCLRN